MDVFLMSRLFNGEVRCVLLTIRPKDIRSISESF